MVEVCSRATMDMLTQERLPELATETRQAAGRLQAVPGRASDAAPPLLALPGQRRGPPARPGNARPASGPHSPSFLACGGCEAASRAARSLAGCPSFAERSRAAPPMPRRSVLVDALQKIGMRYRPLRQAWAANVLLATRGLELTLLKNYLDDGGDYHTCYKLMYNDLQVTARSAAPCTQQRAAPHCLGGRTPACPAVASHAAGTTWGLVAQPAWPGERQGAGAAGSAPCGESGRSPPSPRAASCMHFRGVPCVRQPAAVGVQRRRLVPSRPAACACRAACSSRCWST